MTLLELVMIIKNGADTIIPVLESVAPYIDAWTILDTGSTDGTQELITKILQNIPGKLHQEPFVDFRHSRNRVLDLSENKCKYTLMLDDSYILHGGEHLRRLLQKSREGGYSLRITNEKRTTEYYSLRLLKSSLHIRYKYRVHEIPMYDDAVGISEENIYIEDMNTRGQIQRSYDRFEKDLEMLMLEHQENPQDNRIIRYLGLTNMLLRNNKDSYKWFQKLLKGKNLSDEEKYTGLVNSAILLYKELDGSYIDYIKLLEKAVMEIPYRAEPYYKLAIMYRQLGEMEKALSWIHLGANKPIPQVSEPIDINIYKKEIPYLMIEICLQMKIIHQVVPILKKMLTLYPTEQRFLNIKHAIATPENINIKKLERPVIVFHLGEDKLINPKEKGDNEMFNFVRNISREIINYNFRIVIFGNFGKYEGNVEGIDYIHYEYYSEFVSSYKIYALVATSGKYICLYDNVEKVFLWSHDTYPEEEFIQIHPQKFKKVLTVSNWQSINYHKAWNLPQSEFVKLEYAIIPELYTSAEEKIPYSFLYSSKSKKDLISLKNFWKILKEKYPQSTLSIFGNSQMKDQFEDSVKFISEEDLVEEMKKSQVWFSFYESYEPYWLEILKAQASGCICMGVDSGSIPEIIGTSKGIILDKYSDDKKEIILHKISLALDHKNIQETILEKTSKWVREHSFQNIGKSWAKILNL